MKKISIICFFIKNMPAFFLTFVYLFGHRRRSFLKSLFNFRTDTVSVVMIHCWLILGLCGDSVIRIFCVNGYGSF